MIILHSLCPSLLKRMIDTCPLCEGKFPKRGPHLFGEEFGSKAKKTADNIRALKGVTMGKDRFSRFGGSNKGKQPQSRRYTWGKVRKPHRVQYSIILVPRSKPPSSRSPIRTRNNKHTSTLTQPYAHNSTETGINMSLGPSYYPSPWFSTAFAFPTSPIPEPQRARATLLTVGR